MKVCLPSTTCQMGHEVVEADFGIGDPAAIMGILRGKMYSNPILACVKEISSNARDAHREAGKADLPIEIKLPNQLDKTLHIRDFGPGITPDRMANVFILYGKSTKRADNTQTGGFGLGAKTPFAYSDSFGVITITPDHQFVDSNGICHENCLVKRQYVAYIDPSQKGKMSLQSAEVTEEKQGTTIVVTCKPGDFGNFKKHVQEVMDFWPVKPIIKGDPEFKWKTHTTIFEGSDKSWRIDEKSNDYYDSASNAPTAVIDGIPYPLKANELYKDNAKQDQDVHNFLQFPLRVFFKTGEVLMTAPREDIDYQDWVITHIRSRLLAAVKDLRKQISDKISNAKNLWEANIAWRKLSNTFGRIISKGEWTKDGKTFEVAGDGIYLRDYSAQVFQFTKDSVTIRRKTAYQVNFVENSLLAVEDTDVKVPSKLRIATLFDQNPNAKEVQVIVFTSDTAQKVIDTKKKLEDEKHFSLFSPISLSTIPKKPIVRIGGSTGGFKVSQCKKYHDSSYKSDQWKDAELDLENDEGIYVELRGREAYLVGTEKQIDTDTLKYLISALNIEILGVPTRFLKKIGEDFTPLQDIVKIEVDKLLQDKDLVDYADEVDGSGDSVSNRYSYLSQSFMSSPNTLLNLLNNKTGTAFKYITMSVAVAKIQDKVSKLTRLKKAIEDSSVVKKTKNTLSVLAIKFMDDYPLVTFLNSWDAKGIKMADLAFYLNMCDEAINKP